MRAAIASAVVALRRRGAVVALALPLAGCYVPPPAPHAVVQVSARGETMLDGVPIAPAELHAAVAARAASAPKLVVEIHASPAAKTELLEETVQAIVQAHARVAFARDDATP